MSQNGTSRNPPLYLLTGLVIGLVLGLIYSWLIAPVEYVDTSPASLRADFKDHYRAVIAASYLATGDLARAQSRLILLNDPDPVQELVDQARHALAAGDPDGSVLPLTTLAEALQGLIVQLTPPTPIEIQSGTSEPTGSAIAANATQRVTQTQTIPATPTPRPTRTSTSTPGAPFVLIERAETCDQDGPAGLIQVWVQNAAGAPVPGIEIIISWENGEDSFFTGLKPDIGLGYADFQMTPGEVYILRLASGGAPISGLSAPLCPTQDGGDFWGGYALTFHQP